MHGTRHGTREPIRAPDSAHYAHTVRDGTTYYLHAKPVALPNGRLEVCYSFARLRRLAAAVPALPPGYEVYESPYSGRPYLRKIAPPPDA